MEETFLWIKGRGSFNNDVSQAIAFSLWEVVETNEGAEQRTRKGEEVAW